MIAVRTRIAPNVPRITPISTPSTPVGRVEADGLVMEQPGVGFKLTSTSSTVNSCDQNQIQIVGCSWARDVPHSP